MSAKQAITVITNPGDAFDPSALTVEPSEHESQFLTMMGRLVDIKPASTAGPHCVLMINKSEDK